MTSSEPPRPLSFLSAPPARPRLPDHEIAPAYKKWPASVFMGIFIGYAGFYLIRNNVSLVASILKDHGIMSASDIGLVANAVLFAYGLSKFFMAMLSDRANARYFMPLGLALSAVTNLFIAFVPALTASVGLFAVLMFINGWFQGMGWPPCGKTMVHWWSKKERGTIVSIWNCAHNVGGMAPGALVLLAGMIWARTHGVEATNKDIWQQALYYPGIAAMVAAVFIVFAMKDTPQSCGLPPIEQWKNDYPDDYDEKTAEKNLSTKEIFVTYVLKNRLLWYIAVANVFVYLIRYGVLKWSPVYLSEVKHFDFKGTAIAYTIYELAAIPGTLLCGWVSDKIFKGKRGITGVIFMSLTTIAVVALWMNPATPVDAQGNIVAEYAGVVWYKNPYQLTDFLLMTTVGFLIYGPVMLIGLHALELAPKKAAGTAAGFTGLFGYLGGTVAAAYVIGRTAERYGWDKGFEVIVGGGIIAIILLLITTIEEGKHKTKIPESERLQK